MIKHIPINIYCYVNDIRSDCMIILALRSVFIMEIQKWNSFRKASGWRILAAGSSLLIQG